MSEEQIRIILEDPLADFDLDERAREAGNLASLGYRNSDIAERMGVDDFTIAYLLRVVYEKTGMNKNMLLRRTFERIERVLEESE